MKPDYAQAVKDIVAISDKGDLPETQALVTAMCRVFGEFLEEYALHTNGYMFLSAFVATFTHMKEVLAHAQGAEKKLIEDLMLSIIGSFGKVVQ